MDVSTIVLFASSIALATSTVFIKAPCPTYESVPGLNMDSYKGVWYEIAKYPDSWETSSDCGVIEYQGQNKVFNLSNIVDHKRVDIIGKARIDDGVLYHESLDLERLEGSYVIPVQVVSVDYNEYSLIYSCVYDETTQMRHDFSWLVIRNRDKKDEVVRKTADIIKSLGFIDTTKYIWMNLTKEHCLQ